MAFLIPAAVAAGASASTAAAGTAAAATAASLAATGSMAGAAMAATMAPTIAAGATAAGSAISLGTILSTAAALVGTGVSAYSKMQEGEAQQKIMDANADAANKQAAATEAAGAYEQGMFLRKANKILGRQALAYNAGGVSTAEGSPLAIMAETVGNIEMDAAAIGYNAAVKAGSYRTQADIDLMTGQQLKEKSWWEAGGTLLNGLLSNPWTRKKYANYSMFGSPLLNTA